MLIAYDPSVLLAITGPKVVDVINEVFGHVVSGDGLSVGEVCHLTVDNLPGVVRSNLAQSTVS